MSLKTEGVDISPEAVAAYLSGKLSGRSITHGWALVEALRTALTASEKLLAETELAKSEMARRLYGQSQRLQDKVTASEKLLREVEAFVDRHSEPWYTSGQELLAKIRAAIGKPKAPEPAPVQERKSVREIIDDYDRDNGGFE